MEFNNFIEKHPEITGPARYYARSLYLAGENEENILKAIKGLVTTKVESKSIDLICPHCNGSMVRVELIGGKQATYCPRDRVCLPI